MEAAYKLEAVYKNPESGLLLERSTRRLIVVFMSTAFLMLGGGAIAALLVALTRAPAIELLWPSAFYMALTFHGILMLTIWPHVFEAGIWLWAGTSLIRTKLISPTLVWTAYGLAFLGIVMILGTVASGKASVMYTLYVPMRADPLFYLGHIIYATGLILFLAVFGLQILKARAEGNCAGALPLVTFGMANCAIITMIALMGALSAFVPAVLWAYRIFVTRLDPVYFHAAFWSMGHTLQYTNIIAMVVAWYGAAAFAGFTQCVSEKFSRWAFVLYQVTTLPVFMHHLLVDPTYDHAVKWGGATLIGILLGIPSAMHGIAVPASVEKTLRHRGVTGLFGWFREWGWDNPIMIMFAFSVLLFGFGGFDGTIATTLQLNMMLHDTMWIPAHIHGTLAGGTTVGFMAFSYGFLPYLGYEIKGGKSLARFQAWLTVIGFVVLIAGMHLGSEMGAPRRTQSIRYIGADVPVPHWLGVMNVVGLGGAMSAIGVLLFVGIALASVLSGAKTKPEMVANLKNLIPASERGEALAGIAAGGN